MKKLLLNKAWIVIVLITLASCTKIGRNITVKGKVINPITGQGISGVEIKLLRSQNLQYNGGYKAIKKVISDENGNFEINAMRLGPIYLIPGEIGQNYSLGFNYEGHYYSMKKVDKGKVMHVDYHLVPYGEIKINIHNVNCSGANDTMYFRHKWLLEDDGIDIWSTPRVGCYSFNSTDPYKLPMGTYFYETKVIRSGVTNYVYDTVTINETGVVTLNIDY